MADSKDKYRARQEKRLTDDMSGVVTFTSQCNGCKHNNPPKCKHFLPEPKPEKYRWNKEVCPFRKE